MAKIAAKQRPLKLRTGGKTDVRAQLAALCWRVKNNKLQICIVTTRNSKRWIIPKGWPMHNQTPASAAAKEAFEEAGVSGDAVNLCLGVYIYNKPQKVGNAPIMTMVYPVHVTHVHSKWPEKHQRRRKWLSPERAARKLTEPQLKRIVASFKPKSIGR